MRYFLSLFLFLSFQLKAVEFDYKVDSVLRSFPSGTFVAASLGAGLELWRKKGPLYGYVRPSVTAQSSAVVNSVRAELDIFPISFFGFYGGIETIKRDYEKFQAFQCENLICTNKMKRSYFGNRLALAYKKFYLMSDTRIERVEITDKVGEFADERASLIGRSLYDQRFEGRWVAGYKMRGDLSFGLLAVYNKMKYVQNSSTMWLGFSRYEWDHYALLIGGGLFKTKDNQNVGTVLINLNWVPNKGLRLF